jgi:hypothetical protein
MLHRSDFKLHSFVIGAMPCEARDAVALRAKLEQILARVGLDILDSVPCTDAGQPMPAMFNSPAFLKNRWTRCFSHLLENSVIGAFDKVPLFKSILARVDTLVGQIVASNARIAAFSAAQEEYKSKNAQFKVYRLKKDNVTRWNSSYTKLEAFVRNADVFDALDVKKLVFRDADKKKKFVEVLAAFKADKDGRTHMRELLGVLGDIQTVSKLSQQEGITFHLFNTLSDELLNRLDAFAGSAQVKTIVDVITEEFKARYVKEYPEEVAVAMYLAPEVAYKLWEALEVAYDWDKTTAGLALQYIQNNVLQAYGTHLDSLPPEPLGPVISAMPEGALKKAAITRRRKEDKAAKMADMETRIRKEWRTLLGTIEKTVFMRREEHAAAVAAHKKACTEYETAYAAWMDDESEDTMEPEKPPAEEPKYEPVSITDFWVANKTALPILAQVTRWMCALSISAAEVERLFSRGGLVLTNRRNRLGEEKEELFLLTAYNLTRDWKAAQRAGLAASVEKDIVLRRLYPAVAAELDVDMGEADE